MPQFKVWRDRAYWVREVMHIEAASHEEAEDKFFDSFSPEVEVLEPFRFGNATQETPVEVTECEPKDAI
jgi:hypothetical protein